MVFQIGLNDRIDCHRWCDMRLFDKVRSNGWTHLFFYHPWFEWIFEYWQCIMIVIPSRWRIWLETVFGRRRCRAFIGINQINTRFNDIGNELIDSDEFKASMQNIRCKCIDLLEYQWIIVLIEKWVRRWWRWKVLDRTLWERNNIFINLAIRRDMLRDDQ